MAAAFVDAAGAGTFSEIVGALPAMLVTVSLTPAAADAAAAPAAASVVAAAPPPALTPPPMWIPPMLMLIAAEMLAFNALANAVS